MTPNEYHQQLTEQYGRRASCISIGRFPAKSDNLAIRFVFATSLTDKAMIHEIYSDYLDGEKAESDFKSAGYEQDCIVSDGGVFWLWLVAPESEVGSAWGDMVLIPRTKAKDL